MTAAFALDGANGGRLSSLRIGDYEVIYNNSDEDPKSWGAYPMVPYAGRVDHGRFRFDNEDHQLEVNHEPHAMHGPGFTSSWAEIGPAHLVLQFDDRWPLGGTASHRGDLSGDGFAGRLDLTLAVAAADRAMPAMLGWHPWFNRQLTPDGPTAELRIPNFDLAAQYEVDDSMLPTGKLVSPPPAGPWDHPFRSVDQPIELSWEGQLTLRLRSSCDHWVIFDRMDHALCVEPQSGPPDIFNGDRFDIGADVLQPGDELIHSFTIEWSLD